MFASVILENQLERVKSVFKRMKIADTNSLGPSEPQMRYQTPKKSKYALHQQQMEYAGAFFQVNPSYLLYKTQHHVPGRIQQRQAIEHLLPHNTTIRQDMFVIPIHK